jgi:putative nucleotidyltransferase with HDIG domain
MSEDAPKRERRGLRSAAKKRPSRKLNLASRVRNTLRRGADRILGADVAWSVAFVVVVMLLVGTQRCGGGYDTFSVGQPAPQDIRATYDIDVIDEALTEERVREAAAAIPDVYVHDEGRRSRLAQELKTIFEAGRRALERATEEGSEEAAAAASRELADRVPDGALKVLVKAGFSRDLERELISALTQVLGGMVVGNKSLLERRPSILLVHVPGQREEELTDYDAIVDVSQARDALVRDLATRLKLDAKNERELGRFVASFVDANVHHDWEATIRRREAAEADVDPVMIRVTRGDLLIRKGQPITEEVLAKLDAARMASSGRLGIPEFLGLALITCMLAFFLHRYNSYHQRGFRKLQHLHGLMVLMLLGVALLTQGLLWVAGEVVDGLSTPFSLLTTYNYLVPLGAGSILITLLANGRIAIVYSAYMAMLFGAMRDWDFHVALWALIVQLCGVYAISTYRERAALLRAGLVVGGGGAVTALAVEILRGGTDAMPANLYGAGLAFVGGAVGVGLLISFSLPLLEGLFNVLTDIRLLELSNVNNPLLSELAVKAPGSYNHSIVVGTLAEEAAKSIGANSLFCRVAAFYHDVGKVNHAEYFVENQRGSNPHDRLSPSMSALIISSHVKDGIKLSREAGLPEQIIDIIPQHHGTRLMTYFYEKARNSTDPKQNEVKETDFRYPGPKPQTREAAIFMLADAVEAAARTVDEPSPNRLREAIRKVTNTIVLDGQLDSCDLTFADLERIQESFVRLLVSIYHHRVDYPGFDFRVPKPETKANGVVANSKAAPGT